MRRHRRGGQRPASESSAADLPPGTPTGALRPTDQAAAETVGARRPLDIGQGGSVAASARTATLGRAPRRSSIALGVPAVGAPLQPAFDDHHPPDAALVGDCVHCGFCLPTCPTYVLWGEEMDSPRGRIDLMKQGLEGDPLQDSTVRHLDQCLGCMACVTACPSGVQYDKLIEATRAQVERRYGVPRRPGRPRCDLRPFSLSPPPAGRPRATAAVPGHPLAGPARPQRAPGPATGADPGDGVARAAARPGHADRAVHPATGTRRRTVGLLTGCVQGAFFPDVNAATVRVLAAEGCDVVVPPRQSCCGALSAHGGREEEALRFARRIIETFERTQVDTVVVNAAGCGSNLKEYGHLLRDEPGWAGAPRRWRRRCGTSRSSWTSWDPWRRGTPSRSQWPTRTPATSPTRRGCAISPDGCSAASPGSSCGSSRNRRSAAAAPVSTTCSSRAGT